MFTHNARRAPVLLLLGILLAILGLLLIVMAMGRRVTPRAPTESPASVSTGDRSEPVPTSFSTAPEPPLPTEYQGGTVVTVPIGETQEAHVVDGSILIEFLDVLEDSRCPQDVVCVRAGKTIVRARIHDILPPGVVARRSPPEPVTLPIVESRIYAPPAPENTYTVPRGDWSVLFIRLEPYPISTQPQPEQSAYVATFVVLPAAEAPIPSPKNP